MSDFESVISQLLASDDNTHEPLTNFINNEFVPTKNLIDSFNPSTGKSWIQIPQSDAEDVNKAVAHAKEAFKTWRNTSPSYRASLMNKLADLVDLHNDDLARLESRDQGKPVELAMKVDIPRCSQNFREFANGILHQTASSTVMSGPVNAINYVKYDPIGVAGLISPWNLPLYLLSFKIAPALAAGNTVVCKPSEMTSVTAWVLMHAIKAVGFPPGVVNLVMGEGKFCGDALVLHPDVPLISFTGSTFIGKQIREKAASQNKKVSLEMGGKNAAIVYEKYNRKDIPNIVRSCFLNQGEICLCTSRLFVQKSIYDEFLSDFLAATKECTVGDPESNVTLGAMNSKIHYDKVARYIEYAKEEGGEILCGGLKQMSGKFENGWFINPTVVVGLKDTSRCMTEEIFGPVVCITPFDTAEEVIERTNATLYGLSATVWSTDSSELIRTANELRVGTVWCNTWLTRDLNMPFGGCKHSGLGREGIHDSLHFYADAKTVCIRY